MPTFSSGSNSGSTTLTDDDDIYPAHINELREAVDDYAKNVKNHGVYGDGINDDTDAINAILADKGIIYFPPGTYLVHDSLNYYDDTYIFGAGMGITIIKLADNITKVGAFGILEPYGYDNVPAPYTMTRLNNVTIRDLSVDGNIANNTGKIYECVIGVYRKNCHLIRIEAYNAGEVGIASNADQSTDVTRMFPVEVLGCVMHDNTDDGWQGASCKLTDCWSYDNGGAGYNALSPGEIWPNQTVDFVNCHAYNNNTGFIFETQTAFYEMGGSIIGCEAVRNDEVGINLAVSAGVSVLGNTIAYNGGDGIFMSGNDTDGKWYNIAENIIKNNGQDASLLTGGVYGCSGINFFHEPRYFNIKNNSIFDDQDTPTQRYGVDWIVCTDGCEGGKIEGNTFYGNTQGVFNANVIANANIELRNNYGYNPVGLSAISVSASPFTHTNGASPETVYITGGTVSNIARGTTNILTGTNVTNTSAFLEPHQTLVVTYSSAPTMVKDVM